MNYHEQWTNDNGEKLRYDYDLNSRSIVFDLGAYIGDFSKRIYTKFNCQVYAFEPIKRFYDKLEYRFLDTYVKTFKFGLGANNEISNFTLMGDDTTMFSPEVTGCEIEKCIIRNFEDFLDTYKISEIDLMKINIEGAEYELLNYLIDNKLITKIKNIQIQFHNFSYIPNANNEYEKIINRLNYTHKTTFYYPFIWENWRLK